MTSIQSIIERLGYGKSEHLYYLSQIDTCRELSWHDRRVLRELSPYAVYVVDGSVLVAFFHNLYEREDTDIQCKLWNAQIPVIISDEGSWVKVYSGKSMRLNGKEKVQLSNIADYNPEKCDEKNDFSYWNITNSATLDLYEKDLSKKSLNSFLIENLRDLTFELKEKYHISYANKLVLRILFIRYLIDRGISIGYMGLDSDVKKTQKKFLSIVKEKDKIFSLFTFLKEKFNGNLFEIDERKEREELSDSALEMICAFLTGQIEMKTGQFCLFPFYDFNIIPIELISSIYEILLGKEKQEEDKAFYTPEYLVDYMIQRTVGNYLLNKKTCTVFDPSCGSGIFLVKSLRKILERNASEDGYISDKEEMNRLLKDNIYGVDYNAEAVDVTIFSLYITLFDYQDPKNLADFKLPLLKGENIFFGDFFDENVLEPIKHIKFNFIVGNPPWGKMQQERYRQYCAGKSVIPQEGEICVAFLLKVQEAGDENTECSLVIPSKILYKGKKPSCDFRKKLLSDVCMQQVLELSAVRKHIFKKAIAPAAVLSFTCQKASCNHKLEYISLKPNKYLKLFGIIMIEPDDVKYVEQSLLYQHDELWKILVCGSYWDFELLRELRKNEKTIKDIEEKYRLLHGKGVQDHEPPYVFFKKGLDCGDYTIRAVYTEERLVYKETINCIKGTEKDKSVLLNLTGLLNSSLFAYFNLMQGSSAGIEREQVFLNELEKFPYIYNDKLVKLVKEIQEESRKGSDISALREELNECVLRMYGLQDNYFVDYALKVQIPILCGNYEGKRCDYQLLEQYAKVFSSVWIERLERSHLYFSIKLYPDIKGKFAAFYMQLSFDKKNNDISSGENPDSELEMLSGFMIYKLNDCFYQTKNVAEFEDDAFVIVKPVDYRYWHPAMAVKDSYKVLNAVLLGEEDCE